MIIKFSFMIASDFGFIAIMTALAAIVIFGVSRLLAKPVLNHALKKARPSIDGFKNGRYAVYTTTDVGIDQSLRDFTRIIYASDELRSAAIVEAKKMKIPEKGKRQSFNDLKKHVEEMDEGLQGLIRMVTDKRTMILLRDKAALHVMKDGNIIVGNLKATVLMMQLPNPPFTPINGSDLGDCSQDTLHENVVEHAAGQVVETLLMPGVLSGAKAVWREAGMLIDGQTSWSEAWENGLAPAALKTGATAAAYGLDVIFCFGIPVIATCTRLFMGMFNRLSLKDKTKDDWHHLKKYLEQIQTRKNGAIAMINDTVAKEFSLLPEMLRSVPDFRQQGETITFLYKLEAAYMQDQLLVNWNISNACESKVQALPKRSLVDKFFRINRSAAVAGLYKQCHREMVDQETYKTNSVIKTLKNSPENMKDIFKKKDILLQAGQTMTILSGLFQKLPTMEKNYRQSVEDWENDFSNAWQTGMSNLSDVSKKEGVAVNTLEENLSPYTRQLRERIKANLKRMGEDPALCP